MKTYEHPIIAASDYREKNSLLAYPTLGVKLK